MNVLISGSSGFLGSALAALLSKKGHRVARLVRYETSPGENTFRWNPNAGVAILPPSSAVDAVIHLAGETILGRWNESKKERIRQSRVRGTRVITETMLKLNPLPRTFLGASAVGYYGDRGEEILQEDSAPGRGFLADVCREWESASRPLAEQGVRVVSMRTGIVLGRQGGALQQMVMPFRLGLGGPIGHGGQYMSWISLDDWLGAVNHLLSADTLQGPVNLTAPSPVRNREFSKTLGRVLRRPALLPVPAFAVRAVFGEMADNLLLASARVHPQRLLNSGYSFQHPDLEGALRHLLGR